MALFFLLYFFMSLTCGAGRLNVRDRLLGEGGEKTVGVKVSWQEAAG